jgi:hypothetical protein
MRKLIVMLVMTSAVLFAGSLAWKMEANAQAAGSKSCPTGFTYACGSAGCKCKQSH